MEKVWRKVNQGLSNRGSSSSNSASVSTTKNRKQNVTIQSTDTTSSAGFGEPQLVAAVSQQNQRHNRSASGCNNHTSSPERQRRRRRKHRPSRDDTSGVQHHQQQKSQQGHSNHSKQRSSTGTAASSRSHTSQQQQHPTASAATDQSLRQRAVARLKMFNFSLNWDLQMTQCKPCVPKPGNILTRRLCRNRRRDDNELYRSNSFKFERFERKENNNDGGVDTVRKTISICDDYSLPIDFVKKRPSSFDPCLADRLPDNWGTIATSPLSEQVHIANSNNPQSLTDATQQQPPLQLKYKAQAEGEHQIFVVSEQLLSSGSSGPKSSEEEDEEPYEEEDIEDDIGNENDADIDDEDISTLPNLKSFDALPTKFGSNLSSQRKYHTTDKLKPSPYYYSDLLKNKEENGKTNNKGNSATQQHRQQKQLLPKKHQLETNAHPSVKESSVTKPKIKTNPKYRKSSSLDIPGIEKPEVSVTKRYSITEEGVRIIRCESPSTTTSDDSDCSECRKKRDWHAQALALVRASCNITPNIQMPPHRILGPAICACATAPSTFGDDNDELFRPRSIFYVHQQGHDECADCALSTSGATIYANANITTATAATTTTTATTSSSQPSLNTIIDDMSSSRTRQLYETAFDAKLSRSDDDLDEVDLLNNHSVLLQLNSNNSIDKLVNASNTHKDLTRERSKSKKSYNNNSRQITSSAPAAATADSKSVDISGGNTSLITSDFKQLQIDGNNENVIKSNISSATTTTSTTAETIGTTVSLITTAATAAATTITATSSTSQLPLRGFTSSPPSTAPLPVKFPSKHDGFFINSIKSAPNLPSSAQHPRLKKLQLDVQNLRTHEVPGNNNNINKINNNLNSNNCNNNNLKNNISSITMTGDSSHKIQRPRSVILEPDRVVELKRGHNNHHHNHGGGGKIRGKKFSSTESMTTSSSGGSMESLKSSTSEGNRSTTSSESHHSSSLSSHSSDSGPSLSYPLRAPALLHTKLHILSPISDKSAQEQASELADINSGKNAGSQKQSPDNGKAPPEETESLKAKKRLLPNKTLLILSGDEIQGSDSGISLHSRDDTKIKSAFQSFELHKLSQNIDKIQKHTQDINDLPFDMPKLRRRRGDLQQDFCTSGSATSVDLGELPFDMPKLRRRIRQTQTQIAGVGISSGILNLPQTSTESSGLSQASSSQSVRDDKPMLETGVFRQNLTLNLNESKNSVGQTTPKFASLDLHGVGMASGGGMDTGRNKGLKLNLGMNTSIVDLIDITIPLERQGWYHGAISRIEAENTLRSLNEGSFLVRDSESTRQDYSLSLKSAKGFMHMRIQRDKEFGRFILGQFSRPFETIPEMIKHFCLNRLPVRGAEHMCLLEPVIAQLL